MIPKNRRCEVEAAEFPQEEFIEIHRDSLLYVIHNVKNPHTIGGVYVTRRKRPPGWIIPAIDVDAVAEVFDDGR